MTDILEQQALAEFTEKAYMNYSMYVILDRALPHLADGLKPVQRRIIYSMSELGLKATEKYKKSARTVGDVLGKFHPHGDTACYEAMVLMAQPFSYRYPFVDGQGNWGSADDPKSFAAMRYTEARLSKYADLLLSELQQGTVEWIDNFDGTLQEPSLLPARLPNVLLNGATGIAVGMASDILPHNLTEVANACIHLLDHPKAGLDELCQIIQGPDFPTKAEIITPPEQIKTLYRNGVGSLKMRAVYHLEEKQIVIHALPYQVSGAKVVEQIAQQMQQKKLPMLDGLRDESDHEHPTRLVLIPKSSRVDIEGLMSHLFATTDLERSYRLNFNLIGLDGKPRVKSLVELLNEWLHFRLETVTKRFKYRLNKIIERAHLLEGLLIAFLNIDEVIAIIREHDAPKQELITRFQLSERQAEAILEIKLRHLAKLEEIKLRAEHEDLVKEQRYIEGLLNNPAQLKKLIKKEIAADRDTFGDARNSLIVLREEAFALKQEDILPNEPITVVLSQQGWVRAAKGYDISGKELSYKAQDAYKAQTNARTNQSVVFFDSEGKVYSLPGHVLPSARGQGEPLTGKLNPSDGAIFTDVICGEEEAWVLISCDAGYGFKIQMKELFVKNKNGKACIKLPAHSSLLGPLVIPDQNNQWVAAVTNTGRLLLFPLSEVPVLSKGKGNKFINISASKASSREELMVGIQVLQEGQSLKVCAGKREFTLKPTDIKPYQGERGRRGNRLPRGLQNVSALHLV